MKRVSENQTPGSVRKLEYFESDVSGVALTFKRSGADTLASECGRYQVVRWDIGHGEFVYDANVIEDGRARCIAFEASSAAAKRACEMEAGRLARAKVCAAA